MKGSFASVPHRAPGGFGCRFQRIARYLYKPQQALSCQGIDGLNIPTRERIYQCLYFDSSELQLLPGCGSLRYLLWANPALYRAQYYWTCVWPRVFASAN